MKNTMIRALALGDTVRISAVVTTDLVEEARKRHDSYPVVTAALGRSMTSALLLTWGLKEEGNITLRILGDGPAGGIIAIANSLGEVRGYAQNPHVHLPSKSKGKLDVGRAVGKGMLHVSKDIGLLRPYGGSSELISGEIGEDVANFLYTSDQTPSLVALGVLVDTDNSVLAAGGVIIQALPGASDDALEKIQNHIKSIDPVSSLIKRGYDSKKLIEEYMSGFDYKILEEKEVSFRCNCSRKRLESILISLGKDEIEDIIKTEGKAEVKCHFCNEEYLFDAEDLEALLKE